MNLTARLPEVASLIFNETFNGGSATPAYDKGEPLPSPAPAPAPSACAAALPCPPPATPRRCLLRGTRSRGGSAACRRA